MPQGGEEEEPEVVVVGKRLNNEDSTGGDEPSDRDWGGLGPNPWSTDSNWGNGQGGPLVETEQMLDDEGPKIFRFEDFGFEIQIPAADWARFSEGEKKAIVYILTHYQDSPTLTAALRHLSNEGVSTIELRMDTAVQRQVGPPTPFGTNQDTGQPVAAAISYNHAPGDGTDIVAGSTVIITINANLPMSLDTFSESLIHELVHPYVPDVMVPGRGWTDHLIPGGVEDTTTQIINEMMPRGNTGNPDIDAPSIMNVPNLTGINGTSSVGTANGDQLTGGLNDDFLAGMMGDDVLDGISGNDTLLGGNGQDTLRAGAGSSLLMGGFDADTYIAAGYGTSFTIQDIGGVDRVRLPGSTNEIFVERLYDNLVVTSANWGYSVTVAGHYLDASRVEIFEFSNGTFGASYLEGLVQAPPTECYDERGVLVPCDGFLGPVILDLKGDGVDFSDITRSRVRFDVDQDGRLDRVGWIAGRDDVLLVFDRNGNHKADGPSEISFLADLPGARSDMEGLLGLDSDGDGFLTRADSAFGDFMLWQDRNGNGRSDRGELVSLKEAGIASLSLEIFDRVALNGGLETSQILGRSTVTFENGRTVDAFDAALDIQLARPPSCGCGGSNNALVMADTFSML